MATITASELRAEGVSAIESALQKDGEAVITVRGERRYVVIDLNTRNELREYELDAALRDARNDVALGNYHAESVGGHMERVLG